MEILVVSWSFALFFLGWSFLSGEGETMQQGKWNGKRHAARQVQILKACSKASEKKFWPCSKRHAKFL